MSYALASLSAIPLAIRKIIKREFWWLIALAMAVGFTMLMVYFPPLSMLVSWSQWSPIAACLSTLTFRLGWSSYNHLKALDRTTMVSEDRAVVAKERREHLWTLYFNALMITAAVIAILVLASPATIMPALAAVFNVHLGIPWAWQMAIIMLTAQTLAFFVYGTLYQWSEKSKHEVATHTFYKSAAAAIFTLGLLMGLAFIIVITGICPPLSMLVQDIIIYTQCNFPQAMLMVAVLLLAIIPLVWGGLRATWAWIIDRIQTWSDDERAKRAERRRHKAYLQSNPTYHSSPRPVVKPPVGLMAKMVVEQCSEVMRSSALSVSGGFAAPPRPMHFSGIHESSIGLIDPSARCIHVTTWLQGDRLKVLELEQSCHRGLRIWADGMDVAYYGGVLSTMNVLCQKLLSLAPSAGWGFHVHVFSLEDRPLDTVLSKVKGGVELSHDLIQMNRLKNSSPVIQDAPLLLERLYNFVMTEAVRIFELLQARLGDERMLDSVGRSWTLLMCLMTMVQRLRRSGGGLSPSIHLLLQARELLVAIEKTIVSFDAKEVIVIDNALVINGKHYPITRDQRKRKHDVDELLHSDGRLTNMLVYTDLFVAYHLSHRIMAYFNHVLSVHPEHDLQRNEGLVWHDSPSDQATYGIWCARHQLALMDDGPSQEVMRLLIISQEILRHEHRKDPLKPNPPYLCKPIKEFSDPAHLGLHVLALFCPFDGDESILSLALMYADCFQAVVSGEKIGFAPHIPSASFFRGASQIEEGMGGLWAQPSHREPHESQHISNLCKV